MCSVRVYIYNICSRSVEITQRYFSSGKSINYHAQFESGTSGFPMPYLKTSASRMLSWVGAMRLFILIHIPSRASLPLGLKQLKASASSICRTGTCRTDCVFPRHYHLGTQSLSQSLPWNLVFSPSPRFSSYPDGVRGGGGGGVPQHVLVMLDTINEFYTKENPHSIKLVYIVVFQPDMIKDFKTTIQ